MQEVKRCCCSSHLRVHMYHSSAVTHTNSVLTVTGQRSRNDNTHTQTKHPARMKRPWSTDSGVWLCVFCEKKRGNMSICCWYNGVWSRGTWLAWLPCCSLEGERRSGYLKLCICDTIRVSRSGIVGGGGGGPRGGVPNSPYLAQLNPWPIWPPPTQPPAL